MPMQTLDGFPAVNRALRRYIVHAETQRDNKKAEKKLSDDTFERLEKLTDSPSPVDATVGVAELLYARRNELDSEGRGLAYGLFTFAAQLGFHGLREDNRGMRIANSMARDDGEEAPEGMAWPEPDTDPSAKPELLLPTETTPPAALPTPAAPPPPAASE